jgi:uncharacterized protein (DUF488 family)
MCAEKHPLTCHRSILVCRSLRKSNLEINHILSNGALESHQNLGNKLLSLHKLNQPEPVESEPKQLSLFEQIHSEKKSFNRAKNGLKNLISGKETKLLHREKRQ